MLSQGDYGLHFPKSAFCGPSGLCISLEMCLLKSLTRFWISNYSVYYSCVRYMIGKWFSIPSVPFVVALFDAWKLYVLYGIKD